MNKKTKSSIILTSLGAIAIAGSIIAGSTYALFTSESKTNIAVTSGKVSVTATIDGLTTYTGKDLTGVVDDDTAKIKTSTEYGLTNGTFMTGGTATLDDEKRNLTINNIAPGDKVTLIIKVHNDSNINIKYRTIIKAVNNTGLYEGLTVKLGAEEYYGNTLVSKYATLQKDSDDITLPVVIDLPSSKTNEYQYKSTTISFAVEALQGNAATTDAADNEYLVYTPTDLTVFADLVNKGTFSYTDVLIKDDIDMEGAKYVSPVYDTNSVYHHDLNIIGGNHTISNFAPVHNANHESGFFGRVYAGGNTVSVSDLKFDTVTIAGDYTNQTMCAGGVLVGNIDGGKVNITNVEVNSVNVSDVKYAGALVGYSSGTTNITKCTIKNSTIAGYTAGGVVGQVGGGTTTIEDLNGSEISVNGSKREGGVVAAVSGATLNINNYNINDNSYVATVDGSVVDGGASGAIVGLKNDTTFVNGTLLTD